MRLVFGTQNCAVLKVYLLVELICNKTASEHLFLVRIVFASFTHKDRTNCSQTLLFLFDIISFYQSAGVVVKLTVR